MSLKKGSDRKVKLEKKDSTFKREHPSVIEPTQSKSKILGKKLGEPVKAGTENYREQLRSDDLGIKSADKILEKTYTTTKFITKKVNKKSSSEGKINNKVIVSKQNRPIKAGDRDFKIVQERLTNSNEKVEGKFRNSTLKKTEDIRNKQGFMKKVISQPKNLSVAAIKKTTSKGVENYKEQLESDDDGVKVGSKGGKLIKESAKTMNQVRKARASKKLNTTKLKSSNLKLKKESMPIKKGNLVKRKQKAVLKRNIMKRNITKVRQMASKPLINMANSGGMALRNALLALKKMLVLLVNKLIGTKVAAAVGAVLVKLFPLFVGIGLVLGIVFLLFAVAGGKQEEQQPIIQVFEPEVEQWRPLVMEIAEEKDMLTYVNLILAIIQVESGGYQYRDIMQSSESAGFPRNHYDNERDSINQGINHLKNSINLLKRQNENLANDSKAIGQTYNFGLNFARYLGEHNQEKYDVDIAERYSREVVAPALGNTTGETYSYVNEISQRLGKTYLYKNGGNYMYGELIGQYIIDYEDGEIAPPVAMSPIILNDVFGWRPPEATGGIGSTDHKGLDLHCIGGETTIHTILGGTVVHSEYRTTGFGNNVIVKHADNLYTRYAHMSALNVQIGQNVRTGDILGICGSTGASTGPHLHLEMSIEERGRQFDPLPYIEHFLR